MNDSYNPLYALLIFFFAIALLWLIFRPKKGWLWLMKNTYKVKKKILTEDILKLLFRNENQERYLNIQNITEILKYKNSKAIKIINSMIFENLVFLDRDRLILTESGRAYAIRVVRKHRLWEKYLAEKTGYDKSKWHQIAERKEHETDEKEADLIASKLGNPIFDPHGDPIPSNSGKIIQLKTQNLATFPVGAIGKIVNIEDHPEIIYKQIVAKNIHIGSMVKIVRNTTQQIIFHSEGEEFELTPILAGNIHLVAIDKAHSTVTNDIHRLSGLKVGETATIVGISKESRGEARRRLLDLGFVKGARVSIDLLNPLTEPNAFLIKGTSIAIRNNQVSKILIKKDKT